MTKIYLGVISLLLLTGLAFAGWWGYGQHKALQIEKKKAVELANDYKESASNWMDESFKLDKHNRKIREELENVIQGNPNLDLYLMSSVPPDAVEWVWDFYDGQIDAENTTSGYLPPTREKAVTLGLDNRQVFFTMFETVEKLQACNSKLEGIHKFYDE